MLEWQTSDGYVIHRVLECTRKTGCDTHDYPGMAYHGWCACVACVWATVMCILKALRLSWVAVSLLPEQDLMRLHGNHNDYHVRQYLITSDALRGRAQRAQRARSDGNDRDAAARL